VLTRLREHRCLWLLLALLGLILIMPVADRGIQGRLLLGLFSTIVFTGGIYAVSESRRDLLIGILLMLPPVTARWLHATMDWELHHILLVPSFYGLPFSLFVIYRMAKYVFKGGKVTSDRLQGAVCIYLLLGYLWADLYMVLDRLGPGAFRFSTDVAESAGQVYRELIYFSYVTLTTLGYGDTAPVSSCARSLAILEGICGVLFMGIAIARMAGMLEVGRDEEKAQ
jgi:hypothetical protein